MAITTHRKSGQKRKRAREARRLVRDRKIFAVLRLSIAEAKRRHAQFDEEIEPLSVFYGKPDKPGSWELTPLPLGKQVNGRQMPQWDDLSQWMKVALATMVCHEWELLTFNVNLHPALERDLVSQGSVRSRLAARVRKHLARSIGRGREYFFVLEGHEKDTGNQTHLHLHGAIVANGKPDRMTIKKALGKAAGHNIRGSKAIPRAVHSKWFEMMRVAYPNYLFKFTLRFDPRLEVRRLVMSDAMTQAARMFWEDISRGVTRAEDA